MVAAKSSRVNRQYKTKYRIRNWREYERGLRSRRRRHDLAERGCNCRVGTTEERCFIRELLLTFSLSSTTCDSAWVSRGFSVIKHV